MTQWEHLTALELGRAIARGEVTIPEVTQGALERIAREDQVYHSYLTVTGEQAMDRAHRLQAQLAKGVGPLYGVPMGLKDNLCTRGVPTTCGSKLLEGFCPPYNATVVERLEAAGGVSLGKLNMDEFAMGSTSETSHFGPVRNPWDTQRVAGGSSGGAAAAVAAGLGWYAIGSDTGGSIRQPAAYCGVTGIKPTYGSVSRYGLVAYASSLDQVGPLGRDAADCAAVLEVLQGWDRRDATSVERTYGPLLSQLNQPLNGLRIGLPAQCFPPELDGQTARCVRQAAQVLKERGARIVEVSLPGLEYAVAAYYILASAEASSNLARYDGVKYGWRAEGTQSLEELYCRTRTQGFGLEAKRRMLLGAFVLSSGHYEDYYRTALRARAVIDQGFSQAFGQCDVLLTPVTPAAAPRLGESLSNPLEMYQGDLYTVPVNLAGLPALSMPCGLDGEGLPLGAQLIAPRFEEGVLLRVAHAFQQDTAYHKVQCRGGLEV